VPSATRATTLWPCRALGNLTNKPKTQAGASDKVKTTDAKKVRALCASQLPSDCLV
jgi:hypothetical protein